MKSRFILFIFFLLCFTGLNAQTERVRGTVVPSQPNKSPLFGFDTYINNQPQQNQRNIVICSAFNGWLYGAYNYYDNSVQYDRAVIVRSKDNGVSWSVIHDGDTGVKHVGYTKMDILACGHDTNNLKVFLGLVDFDTLNGYHTAAVVRFDKNGVGEADILNIMDRYIRDLSLASDDLYPAINSNPFSLAVIYSKFEYSDSIVFRSSSNGGMSLNSYHILAWSSHYLHKVALTYGRSTSYNTGRYFAAWEEQDNSSSVSGHIYTAHSEPDFNSSFSTPVLLDSLDATTANMASNPVIACQNNAADNDSSNLTEVVLFEKYIPTTHKFNIAGLYNKKATVSRNFQKFTINASANNKKQPDICFNAFDSTFIVTYFDSTAQKLSYYIHDLNMINPDAWIGLSAGYNDNNNLVSPHPQVVMDFEKQMGANVWIGTRSGGNGAAMFDSPFTYYTGIPTNSQNDLVHLIGLYPNPSSTTIRIAFELKNAGNLTIDVMDIMGQTLGTVTDQDYSPGKHVVQYDVSGFPNGNYLYNFRSDEFSATGKFTVVR